MLLLALELCEGWEHACHSLLVGVSPNAVIFGLQYKMTEE